MPGLHALLDEAATTTRGVGLWVQDDLIIVPDQVDVPPTSVCLQQAFTVAHGVGHDGIAKTLHHLHIDFHVFRTCTLVTEFVRACATC
jgi:hypothetical protein